MGRQLAQMAKEGMTVQYRYDHNGLRVAKIVSGVETKYILNGKQLTHLHRGNDWMHFFYDIQGRPAKVRYNGTIYSYIHNLQGDIVGIIDTDGNVVVEYKYDAWGKALSTTGTLAGTLGNLNPFRYRGYIYDEETGLYYLRSRYYNPVFGRFTNADLYICSQTSTNAHNIFAYCKNQYINCADMSGAFVFVVTVGLEDSVLKDDLGIDDVDEFSDCDCYRSIVICGAVPMRGAPNGYASGYNGDGELYEAWYDTDGNIIRARHHSQHRNPKMHPKNPHDHRGTKDKNGNPTISHDSEDPDPNFKTPKSANEDQNTENVIYGGASIGIAVYVIYRITKTVVGIIAAPATGGASLIPILTP